MQPDLSMLRQAVHNFTQVNPKGMSVNEMVDLLVDQLHEMNRRKEYGSGTLAKVLMDAVGQCNEFFLEGDKGYRCNCFRYSTHSHQDYSLKQQVKMGLMREVEVTPQNVLAEIEEAFHVNGMLERKPIIKAICKALGKPYNKSRYLN